MVSVMKTEQRRNAPRFERGVTTTARFGGRQHVCILKDVSRTGARIAFNPHEPLPSKFELDLGPYGIVPVVQVWRRGNMMGVRRVQDKRSVVRRTFSWISDAVPGKAA